MLLIEFLRERKKIRNHCVVTGRYYTVAINVKSVVAMATDINDLTNSTHFVSVARALERFLANCHPPCYHVPGALTCEGSIYTRREQH